MNVTEKVNANTEVCILLVRYENTKLLYWIFKSELRISNLSLVITTGDPNLQSLHNHKSSVFCLIKE